MKILSILKNNLGDNAANIEEKIKPYINEGLRDNFKEFAKDQGADPYKSYIEINVAENALFFTFQGEGGAPEKVRTSIYEMLNYLGEIPFILYTPMKFKINEWEKNLLKFCRAEERNIIIILEDETVKAAEYGNDGKRKGVYNLSDIVEKEVTM